MYKSDIVEALSRIVVSSGGPIDGLLQQTCFAREQFDKAEQEFAKSNDGANKVGHGLFNEAIQHLAKRVSQISPSGTVVELHQLGERFDKVLTDHPELEPILRPGKQAAANLAGAFDVMLQQSRRPSALAGLVTPGVALSAQFDCYRGTIQVLSSSFDDSPEEESSTIEIDGISQLVVFGDFMSLLGFLSSYASSIVGASVESAVAPAADITIRSIESGSPIRVTLGGNGKTIRFLLAMLRDAIRMPYLHLTSRGQAVQAMETLAYAKKLGVNSPEAIRHLEEAVVVATRRYAEKISSSVVVSVDGKPVAADALPLLVALPTASESDASSPLRLPNPDTP